MKRVLLRDIAKAAGVSHVSVSLGLRNHPSIGLATRQRIQKIAQELGYRPDPMLRALAEYRRGNKAPHFQGSIAWLNYHPEPKNLERYPEYQYYREGAETRARELGYQFVVLTPASDKMTSKKLERVLQHRNIQGLLLPPQPNHHAVLDFDFSNFTAVAFGFSLASPQLHLVTNRHFHSSRLAVQVLWSYGYRRIALTIGLDMNERTEGALIGGYLTAPELFSNPKKLPPFITTGQKSDRKTFEQWLRKYRPDALITDNQLLKKLLEESGCRVPEDIALVDLAADPRQQEFAGINQNGYEIGRLAVETVVGMLYRNETGVPRIPHRLLVEGQWHEGRSAPNLLKKRKN
jgi:LacI family transcriptional regulator